MADLPGRPRRLDLSLSSQPYMAKLDRVRDWLENSKSVLQMFPEAEVIRRVRAGLGAEVATLSDTEIGGEVRRWAERHGYRLVIPPTVKPPIGGDPEFVLRLKRVLGTIPGAVNVNWNQGSASISVSGATATLRSGKCEYAISRGWDGEIKFKTEAPGAVFTASMSPEQWKLTFTIGQLAPNISDLETVFKKGEAALRGVLAETGKIDWNDPSKTKEQFSPYLEPIKTAVDATAKAAAQKPGTFNFGVWLEGDVPGAPAQTARGVKGGLRLTVLF